MRKRVCLLFGGRSLEKDISVITAMQTLQNIDRSKYKVEPIYMYDGNFYVRNVDEIESFAPFNALNHSKAILHNGVFYIIKRNTLTKFFKPDVALICCHGGEGEDGTLQALLQYNQIPHTSPDILQSALGMDKALAKDVFDQMLLNTLPHEVINANELNKNDEELMFHLENLLDYPMIVKPSRQGSSIGIGVATNREELIFALNVAGHYDTKIIVEQKLVDFAEVNCACFRDGEQLIVSETEQPISINDFLTFEDKYQDNGKLSGGGHVIPADIGALNGVVKANTIRIYKELNLNGVVRMDFLVDKTRDKVYINEINTVPGSMAFYLFSEIGISFESMLTSIIENSEAYFKDKNLEKEFATNVLENYSKNSSKVGNKNRKR